MSWRRAAKSWVRVTRVGPLLSAGVGTESAVLSNATWLTRASRSAFSFASAKSLVACSSSTSDTPPFPSTDREVRSSSTRCTPATSPFVPSARSHRPKASPSVDAAPSTSARTSKSSLSSIVISSKVTRPETALGSAPATPHVPLISRTSLRSTRGQRRPLRRWITESPVHEVKLDTSARASNRPSNPRISTVKPKSSSTKRCFVHVSMSRSSQCQLPTFFPSWRFSTIHRLSPLPSSAPPLRRSEVGTRSTPCPSEEPRYASPPTCTSLAASRSPDAPPAPPMRAVCD
mmetsp:Transcript_3294/g.7500  ORF Transcript_3294/g.7500 Transcript_3294/m.7500 type:complete len:289 (+) Transcript_3294:452-1318(+)